MPLKLNGLVDVSSKHQGIVRNKAKQVARLCSPSGSKRTRRMQLKAVEDGGTTQHDAIFKPVMDETSENVRGKP